LATSYTINEQIASDTRYWPDKIMPLYYPKLCLEAVKNHDRCHLGLEKNAEYPKQ